MDSLMLNDQIRCNHLHGVILHDCDNNYTATYHTMKQSSLSDFDNTTGNIGSIITNNNTTIIPSTFSFDTMKHPLNYNGSSSSTNNSNLKNYTNMNNNSNNHNNDSKEGTLIVSIFFLSMIFSLMFVGYLIKRYDYQVQRSDHHYPNERNGINDHHSSDHHDTTTKKKIQNVQEEYIKIEASLCNMYVVQHHSEYCQHNTDIDIDYDHAHYKKERENDVIEHHSYDIESYCEKKRYDTNKKCSIHHCNNNNNNNNNNNKQSHNDHENSSIHSSATIRSSNNSIDDEDDDGTICYENECSICLDQFHVGQIVSMSTGNKCQHIFHHECIKEWLLKNNTCPSCRQVILEDNNSNSTIMNHENVITNNMINNCSEEHDNNKNNKTMIKLSESIMKNNIINKTIMFYCIHHGIGFYTPNNDDDIDQSIVSSSSSSYGCNIDNDPCHQVVCHPSISVPTPSALAHMRIQQQQKEQQTESSSASLSQSHQICITLHDEVTNLDDNNNNHHHYVNTAINHHQVDISNEANINQININNDNNVDDNNNSTIITINP